MTKYRKLAYIALIINAIIWGAALPIVKPALEFVTPYQYLFYRYLLAVPLSIPILVILFVKYKPKIKALLTIFFMEMIVIAGGLSFLYEGLNRTTSIEASLIANASPIFIIVGGIIFLKEKEEMHEFVGLMLALIGMVILTLEPILSGGSQLNGFSFQGNVLVLGHNILWATYIILAKKVYKNIPKLLIGFMSLWVGLIVFYVIMRFTTPLIAEPSAIFSNLAIPQVLIASLYMGLLGSILAVPLYIYGISKIEVSEASLFSYLQPLVTIPLAVYWLKESINLLIIFALILTLVGVFIAERRPNKSKAKLKKSN